MLSYQWHGIETVQQRLSALAALRDLEGDLEAGGDEIVTEARVYPPQRPGQRYRRTEDLKRGWRRTDARRDAGALVVDVENPVAYGSFVQGDDQAPVHRGRWKRLKVIGQDQLPAIRARASAWAVRTWRGA